MLKWKELGVPGPEGPEEHLLTSAKDGKVKGVPVPIVVI